MAVSSTPMFTGEEITGISFCAGSGGLDLALRLAVPAARTVCYVEREASAAASLVASMEAGILDQAPVWSDAATFDARAWRGAVDIVTSGDPCQPNSNAGRKGGEDDERFLIGTLLDTIKGCRPHRLLRENVTGNAAGQLRAIVPPLAELGYRVAAGIFSSEDSGNSHKRQRLIILAERDMQRCTAQQSDGEWDTITPQHGEELANDTGFTRGCNSGQRRSGKGAADAGGERAAVGHDPGERRGEGHRGIEATKFDQGCTAIKPILIPGPDNPIWREILRDRPDLQPALNAEEAESLVCRGVDALAYRTERLRHCGNGVDPVAVALAYLYLDALLRAEHR